MHNDITKFKPVIFKIIYIYIQNLNNYKINFSILKTFKQN